MKVDVVGGTLVIAPARFSVPAIVKLLEPVPAMETTATSGTKFEPEGNKPLRTPTLSAVNVLPEAVENGKPVCFSMVPAVRTGVVELTVSTCTRNAWDVDTGYTLKFIAGSDELRFIKQRVGCAVVWNVPVTVWSCM